MEKKLTNTAFCYACVGLALGVFYRELTRMVGFTAETALSVLHTHSLMLGMVMALGLLLLERTFSLFSQKRALTAWWLYQTGLIVTLLGLLGRGLFQVTAADTAANGYKALNASISGISGLGHIMLAVGLVWLLHLLKKAVEVSPRN